MGARAASAATMRSCFPNMVDQAFMEFHFVLLQSLVTPNHCGKSRQIVGHFVLFDS